MRVNRFATRGEAARYANRFLNKPGLKVTIRKLKDGYKVNVGQYGPVRKPQKEIIWL